MQGLRHFLWIQLTPVWFLAHVMSWVPPGATHKHRAQKSPQALPAVAPKASTHIHILMKMASLYPSIKYVFNLVVTLKISMSIIRTRSSVSGGKWSKGHEGTFHGNRNVLYFHDSHCSQLIPNIVYKLCLCKSDKKKTHKTLILLWHPKNNV